MKILVVTSRYTATRDIVSEDFGRQTRLFSALAKKGHDVTLYVADYRKHERKNTKLHGMTIKIRPFSLFSALKFYHQLKKEVRSNNYDVVIATSDPLWGFYAFKATRTTQTKFVYDLHDNYETYATYRIPLFGLLDKHVMRKADLVTTVSHTLARRVKQTNGVDAVAIQNGVDTNLFKSLPQKISRKKLGLNPHKKIIVYTGSLQRVQGIDLLVDAFDSVRKQVPDAELIIAGRFYQDERKHISLHKQGIRYLGSLPQAKIPLVINAADVAVIPNPKNAFTQYCFPYKLAEYLSCKVPVLATNVGDVGSMLKNNKQNIIASNNKKALVAGIIRLLKNKKIPTINIKNISWQHKARELEKALTHIP